jgi:hypothetical protein
MRNGNGLSQLVARLLLFFCLVWPAAGQAAQEFYFEGSPDRVLPDMVPPNASRLSHPGPKPPNQGPAAWYGYDWKVKNRTKGTDAAIRLSYTVYEPMSTRYGWGSETKSNTMAAFLDVTSTARGRICAQGSQAWTLYGTNVDKSYLQTCSGDVSKTIRTRPAPQSSYVETTWHSYYSDKTLTDQQFTGHYGNVVIRVEVRTTDGTADAASIGQAALAKLSGKVVAKDVAEEAAATKEEQPAPPKDAGLVVEAVPSLLEVGSERTALIPASEFLPAKLSAKTVPGAQVVFEIASGKAAELRAGSSKGSRVSLKADAKGLAETLFFYTGENIKKAPLPYEVRITTPGHKETVKVLVGLGLAFDRIVALKTDQLNTYAFTLSLQSRVHPKLILDNYLYRAHQSGVWGDRRLGVKLRTTWLNPPPGVLPEPSFQGTARIIRDRKYGNLLAAGSGEPKFTRTGNDYPAVVMQSDGKHVYRVNGGLVLLDANDQEAGYIREGMEQGQALAIVARETPEHWLTSLACSLEVQDEVQYVMLETAKMLPGGDVVDALTTATGLMCKFGQGEYESLFYDLGTLLGGKYLDHLNEPEVLKKLTPKQQEAAKVAKKSYDKLDEYKQREERDKWLGEAGKRLRETKASPPPEKPLPPPADSASTTSPSSGSGSAASSSPASAPASGQENPLSKAGDDLKKGVEDLQKSFEDLGKNFKGIFGK